MSLTQEKQKSVRAKLFAKLTTMGAVATATRNDTGATFQASRTQRMSSRQIESAGWQLIYEFSIRASWDDAGDIEDRTTVTFDGVEYKVLQTAPDTNLIWMVLHLGDKIGQRT